MYRLVPPIMTPDGAVEQKAICRIADNAFIPFDPDNRDYVEYQEWLAAGNQPLPAEENQ